MEILFGFLVIGTVTLLAAMSPGPDFAIVTKNCLLYSRSRGIFTAIGIALGILVHVSYLLAGIGLIISQSILLFNVIKVLGALYLIYLGLQLLRSKPTKPADQTSSTQVSQITQLQALWQGFLTNVLNPKATLFFLSVFTQVIGADMQFWVQVLYGLEMSMVAFLWFAVLSFVLTVPAVKRIFSSIQHHVERVMGAMLIALGIKVVASRD